MKQHQNSFAYTRTVWICGSGITVTLPASCSFPGGHPSDSPVIFSLRNCSLPVSWFRVPCLGMLNLDSEYQIWRRHYDVERAIKSSAGFRSWFPCPGKFSAQNLPACLVQCAFCIRQCTQMNEHLISPFKEMASRTPAEVSKHDYFANKAMPLSSSAIHCTKWHCDPLLRLFFFLSAVYRGD